MIRTQIADDVFLNYIPQTRFKANYLTMNFLTPMDRKTAAGNALVPRILSQGCTAYPGTIALAERLQSLYNLSFSRNRVFKRGETQVICQSAWMLDNSVVPDGTDVLGGALELLGEIWFSPLSEGNGFVSAFTDHAKKDTMDGIRALINNKNNYAPYRCNQEMCRNERYGIPVVGTLQDVSDATPEGIYTAYQSLLSRARCEIFYVGRGGEDRVARTFADLFSRVNRMGTKPISTEVIRDVKSVREVREDQPVQQGKLSMGFRTGLTEADGGRAVMLMLNEIYGSGPVSKLFMNVRERLGLCYHCSSSMDLIKGIMMVNCGIDSNKKDVAQGEILHQLEEIRRMHITDAEFDAAKKSIRSAIMQVYDEPSSMEMWWLGRMLSGRDVTPEEEIINIENITKADIASAAQNIQLDTVYFMNGTGGEAADEDE